MIQRINLQQEVKFISVKSLLELDDLREVKLNEDEFKSVLSVFGVLSILKCDINNEEDFLEKFKLVFSYSEPLLNCYYRYIFRLIDVLPELAKNELDVLKNESYGNRVFKDLRLYNFSAEFIYNEINMVRNHEFGQFCLHTISNSILRDQKKDKLEKFGRRLKIDNGISFVNKVMNRIGPKDIEKLDSIELNLIMNVFIQRFDRSNLTQMHVYNLALNIKKYGLMYQKKINKVELIIKNVIDKDLNRGLKR